MRRNYMLWFWLFLPLPLVCAVRDPFLPVADPCEIAQLSLWRYRGSVQADGRAIAFMQNPEGKWQRVAKQRPWNAGWRVTVITRDTVTVDTGERCEPRSWQWKREGTRNDKKDKPVAAGVTPVDAGRERHAGG